MLLKKGLSLHNAGRLKEAEYCYQLVLRSEPNNAVALNQMGTLAVKAGKYSVSVGFLERAVRIAPKSAQFRNNLANALLFMGLPEKALPHLRKALKVEPGLLPAMMNLVRAYRSLGHLSLALETSERVLLQHSSYQPALIAAAELNSEFGRWEVAERLYRLAMRENSLAAAAIAGLAEMGALDDNDEITILERKLENAVNLNTKDIVRVHHAIGRVHDRLRNYEAAFGHYVEAKRVSKVTFDIGSYRDFVNQSCNSLTSLNFVGRMGDQSEVPVFIVGMPRSGTSLVEQIMASHPEVHGAGELADIAVTVSGVQPSARNPMVFTELIKNLTSSEACELSGRYLSLLRRISPQAKHVTNKTPHNFEALGFIAKLFPRAKIVHCIRNPLDNCLSCYAHDFNEQHGYNADLKMLGLYYREYWKLMTHWRRILPINIFDLRYEDLVRDQEGMSRQLVAFLGLEWSDSCLEFYKLDRPVQTPSKWQVRQPMHGSAIGKWQNYEKFLDPLKDALGDLCS